MAKKAKSASGAKKSAPAKHNKGSKPSSKATPKKAASAKATVKAKAKASALKGASKVSVKSSVARSAKTQSKASTKSPAKSPKSADILGTKSARTSKAKAEKSPAAALRKAPAKKSTQSTEKKLKASSAKLTKSAGDKRKSEIAREPVEFNAEVTAKAPVPTAIVAAPEIQSSEAHDDQDSIATEVKSEKRKKRDEIKIDRNGNLQAQWQLLYDRSKGLDPLPYKMSDNFDAKTAIVHKVLGWGFVLSSQNNRLEVLFKEGIKILIANYKAS